MSNEQITINKIKLASSLAHEEIIRIYNDDETLMFKQTEGIYEYKEDVQNEFNIYFDKYIEMIEDCKM
jgi:hypothetical protein